MYLLLTSLRYLARDKDRPAGGQGDAAAALRARPVSGQTRTRSETGQQDPRRQVHGVLGAHSAGSQTGEGGRDPAAGLKEGRGWDPSGLKEGTETATIRYNAYARTHIYVQI